MQDIISKHIEGNIKIFENHEDSFKYQCMQCGNCCQKITVTIDPYDVLRLKKALNKTTTEIMQYHLGLMQEPDSGWPVAFLRSAQTDRCEFNKDNKCLLWKERPKVCRLFPLGMASKVEVGKPAETVFYLLKRENACKGFQQDEEQTVAGWLEESDLAPYLDEYQKFTSIKYRLLEKYDFNAIDSFRVMLLCMALYDFDALFSLSKSAPNLEDLDKYHLALAFYEWLVSEIVPDKSGRYNGELLSPEMPKEVFFAALEKKLLEMISTKY